MRCPEPRPNPSWCCAPIRNATGRGARRRLRCRREPSCPHHLHLYVADTFDALPLEFVETQPWKVTLSNQSFPRLNLTVQKRNRFLQRGGVQRDVAPTRRVEAELDQTGRRGRSPATRWASPSLIDRCHDDIVDRHTLWLIERERYRLGNRIRLDRTLNPSNAIDPDDRQPHSCERWASPMRRN